jgi:hypothetical protein
MTVIGTKEVVMGEHSGIILVADGWRGYKYVDAKTNETMFRIKANHNIARS